MSSISPIPPPLPSVRREDTPAQRALPTVAKINIDSLSFRREIFLQDIGPNEHCYADLITYNPPPFSLPPPEQFCQSLRDWEKWLSAYHYSRSIELQTFTHWLSQFPISHDAYWEAIPQAQLSESITLLAKCVRAFEKALCNDFEKSFCNGR